ncbi:hypothetical protein O9929_12630 [Vibrio lentus]|nr:hypothetical protein [Vibrio lentus]
MQYTDGIGVTGWSGTQIVNVCLPPAAAVFRLFNYTVASHIQRQVERWLFYCIPKTLTWTLLTKDGKEWFNAGIRPHFTTGARSLKLREWGALERNKQNQRLMMEYKYIS